MQVTPFLILAIGVDNMFLLAQLEATNSHIRHIPERIAATLEAAGPSIALASLAEALAFAVAAFTPMPAVRCFAIVAAVAVLLDFALQLTAFVALLTLDCERTRDGRADCWPCWSQRAAVSGTPLSRDFQVRTSCRPVACCACNPRCSCRHRAAQLVPWSPSEVLPACRCRGRSLHAQTPR